MSLITYDLMGKKHDKVQVAIDRLRAFEPEDGYYLAFSGGKDSQCIYHLAEMAGVKFDAHYRITSVDPPELVRFIKTQYPAVHMQNNDLISRSALLGVISEAIADEASSENEIAYAEGWNDCLESFRSIIKYAPTVDAEPVRHGRWIHDTNNLFGCSECMERDTMSFRRGLKNYCPNCGAKMDGDVDAAD